MASLRAGRARLEPIRGQSTRRCNGGAVPPMAWLLLALLLALLVRPSSELTARTSVDVGGGARVVVALRSFKDLRDLQVVKQAYDYSCGPAALATLLTYAMGDPTTEREIIDAVVATLDRKDEELRKKEGFSLLDMQRFANSRGYRAQGFRIAPEFLDKLRGAAIVFIKPRGYEHFAVLRGVRRDRVYLADPSLGNVRRSRYDFLDMWLGDDGKGIIFLVEPAAGAVANASVLGIGASDLPRPELMSMRQLLDLGRTLQARPGAR